jgi:beta-galactosidase
VTTGPTVTFRLAPEDMTSTRLRADGQDMAHVRVTLLDSAGRVSKMDPRRLTVTLEGPGRLLGLDNGDMRRSGSFRGATLPSYFGTALVRLQAGRERGTLRLHVRMEGCADEQTIAFEVQ